MLIGELAAIVGLDAQTIRFYERQGLLPEPRRQANGYRAYDGTSVERLRFVRNAQGAGLTLAEIGSILALRDHNEAPCTHVMALLDTKLDDVRARRAELAALEAELDRLIARGRDLDPTDCSDSEVCQILNAPHRTAPKQSPSGPTRNRASTVKSSSIGSAVPA